MLERNPFYRGSRPANADRIVYSVNTDSNQSLLQVRAGQVDYDASGLPPSAHDDLAKSFGVRKSGSGRYFVNPGVGVQYLALNTSRPALSRLAARKAVNHAIDRPALVRVGGKFAAKRTDQILAPGMRGFRDASLYPPKGCRLLDGKGIQDASRLTGDARYAAYRKLDVDLMRGAAPWAPYANPNMRELVSSRVTYYVFHPVYSGAALTALALKK